MAHYSMVNSRWQLQGWRIGNMDGTRVQLKAVGVPVQLLATTVAIVARLCKNHQKD